jgi:hypothetical protein
VGQLTLSVFRSFEKLEQALTSTQLTVNPALGEVPYHLGQIGRQRLAARLSPPYLRLAEPLAQSQGSRAASYIWRIASEESAIGEPKTSKSTAERFANVMKSLRDFEVALANAEGVATKALTHPRFGVSGPPKISGEGPPKISGVGPPKISGEGPPKISGEGPPKISGEGIFPLVVAGGIDGGDGGAGSETRSVAALYGQVAGSFQQLENAAAKLENLLRAVLTDPAVGVDTSAPQEVEEYRRYAAEQVEQSFRDVNDMLTYAKLTTVEVTMHPVYGLGPGSQPGLGAAGRQRLAVAAGLSPQTLRLL